MLLEIAYHNIDPILFQLGPLKVQWYGLSYMVSFILAYIVLSRLQRGGYLRLVKDDVMSLLMFCIVGTIIGGRLGWVLFYSDFIYSGKVFHDPLILIGLEDGEFKGLQGLSFHGGLIGIVLFGFIFCRSRARKDAFVQSTPDATPRQRFGMLVGNAFDACTFVAPLGIFLVRTFGNFINGELYGRIITDEASAPSWAMRFPTSPEGRIAMARASGVHPNAQHFPVDPSLWESVKAQVPLRHPSQIYQALCEGLAVFILLWFLRRRFETRGMIGAAFLIAYGAARFPMEWFRQPDAQFESGNSMSGWGEFLHTLHLTQGQLLCLGMIVAGAICAYFFKRSSNPYKRIDALDRSLRGEAMVELPKD